MQTDLQTDSGFGGIMDAGTRLLPAASGEGARKEMALHHLPCVIDHDGPANVSSYFVISEDKTTSLRGRQLKGVDRNAPEGWEGAQARSAGIYLCSPHRTRRCVGEEGEQAG